MKILITGATGFLGSHLTEYLAQAGHELFVLVRDEEKFKKLNLKATAIVGSLRYDKAHDWIHELPHDLDAVIHNAGIVHAFDFKKFYDTNARATERLIEDLATLYPNNLRFCFISSLAASGPSLPKKQKTEEEPLTPVSHYGHSKHLAEIYLEKKAPATWKKTIIRPPIIIGPRDEGMLDVFKMIKQGIIAIPGLKGQHKEFSFVAVFDLISIIEKAILFNPKKNTPEAFFVAHPRAFTYSELIARISNLVGPAKKMKFHVPIFILFLAACFNHLLHRLNPKKDFRLTLDKIMEIKASGWVSSSSKADEVLAINYQWNLEQILKVTFEDYQKSKKL